MNETEETLLMMCLKYNKRNGKLTWTVRTNPKVDAGNTAEN